MPGAFAPVGSKVYVILDPVTVKCWNLSDHVSNPSADWEMTGDAWPLLLYSAGSCEIAAAAVELLKVGICALNIELAL